MSSTLETTNARDWISVAICLVVALSMAIAMASQDYLARLALPLSEDHNYQRTILIGFKTVFEAGFFTICFSVSLCSSISKCWLKWPFIACATPVIGAYPNFLIPSNYPNNWQISAFATVTITFFLLLVTQRLLGEFSTGSRRSKTSRIALLDFFALTLLVAATMWAIGIMGPFSLIIPQKSIAFNHLESAACISLPMPIAAYAAFSKTRQNYALLFLVLVLAALSKFVHVRYDLGGPFQFVWTYIFSQLTLFCLLAALRFRGVRIGAAG